MVCRSYRRAAAYVLLVPATTFAATDSAFSQGRESLRDVVDLLDAWTSSLVHDAHPAPPSFSAMR